MKRRAAPGAFLLAARPPAAWLLLASDAPPVWLFPLLALWIVPAAGVIHALTSSLRAETARERHQARSLVEGATGAALFVVEPATGFLLESNDRARRLFGDACGGRRDLWALAAPGGGAALKALLEAPWGDAPPQCEARWLGQGGREFSARLLAAESAWGERRAWLIFLLEEGSSDAERRRLEELAKTAAFAAHDVKNAFQSILACAEGAARRGAADPQALAAIADAARAGGGLARKILDPAPAAPNSLPDPAACAQSAARRFEAALPGGFRFTFEAAPPLPPLLADAAELERALGNLLDNARDAARGRVRLTVRGLGVDEGEAPASASFRVDDDGPGIAPELAQRLGTPFLTGKAPGKGTGLGLAQARALAERCGGDLCWGESAWGGASFELLLPAAPRAGLAACLVIDADDRARGEVDRALKLAGREVFTAPDAERGLAILEREGRRIGVVIVDLVLPGLSGRRLLELLRQRAPWARVAAHSSATGDAAREGSLALGARAFFAKPADAARIRRWVLAPETVSQTGLLRYPGAS